MWSYNHTSPDCVNMWSASNKSVRYQTAVRIQRGWSGDHCVHISVHTVKWSLCSLGIGTHPVLTLCMYPSYGSLDKRHDNRSCNAIIHFEITIHNRSFQNRLNQLRDTYHVPSILVCRVSWTLLSRSLIKVHWWVRMDSLKVNCKIE